MTDSRPAQSLWCITVAAILLAVIFLRGPFYNSLWLDELISYWLIKDGPAAIWNRCLEYQGQSPYYFYLLWAATLVLGSDEWALRMPSLLCGLASLYLIQRIARRWLAAEGAWLAVIYLAAVSDVQAAFFSARPYSLALMSTLLSIFCLQRWLDSGSGKWRFIYVLSCLSAFYAHYLFAAILFVHLAIFTVTPSVVSRKNFLVCLILWLALCLPGAQQVVEFASSAQIYSFAPPPSLRGSLAIFLPYRLALCSICGLACAVVLGGASALNWRRADIKGLVCILWWWLLPLALFVPYAWLSGSSLLMQRYFLWNTPALAVFLAGFSAVLASPGALRVFFAVSMILLFRVELSRKWVIEDWKGAVARVNSETAQRHTAVLFDPGMIELDSLEWLEKRQDRKEALEYLTAPIFYYRLNTAPLLFPWGPGLAGPFDTGADDIVKASSEIILLGSRNPILSGKSSSGMILDGLRSRGFTALSLGDFGRTGVWRLVKEE